MPRSGRAVVLLAAVPVLYLGYFYAWPVARILAEGLVGGEGGLGGFGEVLSDADLAGVAWFTLWQAAASTLLTLVVAMPAAWMFARLDFPGKRLLRALVTVPFVLPTVVVASAFLALLGPGGPLGIRLDETVWAILAAHVFFNYAIVVRTVGGLWAHIDPRHVEAARVLGAGRLRAFTHVTLPLLRPAIAAAAALVFLFTFTSFGVVLILGGPRLATLEVEIYRQTTQFLDLGVAAALAILQLVGVTAILLAYARYQDRRRLEMALRPAAEVVRPPRRAAERAAVAANLTVMAVLLGSPLAVLVHRSLRVGGRYGLDHYRTLADSDAALAAAPVEAVRNSVGFAAVATLLALAVGLAAAAVVVYRRGRLSRWFDTVLMLPLGTSAVTIGFGFLVALGEPVDLRTSALLIPIAHSLVAIPLVVRTVVPVAAAVRHRLREAAAVLGASPGRAWREVDLPLLRRAALVGAAFAFAVSLGEFGATSFIVRPDYVTMPVAVFRFLGRPGAANFGAAMALSVVLMVLAAAGVAAIERFRVGEAGEF